MVFFLVFAITLLGAFQPVSVASDSETNIEIINPQSFPTVGGEWTVHFETVGTADLVITAINETTFGDISPNDLKFLAINDGTQILTPVISGNTITYPNYSSTGQGFVTYQVLTSGAHHLMFEFGNDVGYANNDAADAWCDVSAAICNSDWANRFEIVIDDPVAGTGAGDLSNFPILVHISGTDFTNNIDSGSDTTQEDIRFFNDAATPVALDYEIEKFDQTDNELIAWVKIPTLDDDGETTIYMYYNNPNSVSTTAVAADVWSNGYVAVWHMTEANIVDSTGNGHTGTNSGTVDIASKSGLGQARDFDGTSDVITVADHDDLSFGDGSTDSPFTITGWIKQDTSNDGGVISKASGSTPYNDGEWYIYAHNARFYNGVVDDSLSRTLRDTTDSRATVTNWNHVAWTYDGGGYPASTSTIITYENGSDLASSTAPNHDTYVAMENSADTVKIGARGGINSFGGIIDEVRISDVERSADWIATEYNNQNDPSSFYTLTVEAIPPTMSAAVTGDSGTGLDKVTITFSENVDATTTDGTGWTVTGTDAGGRTVTANTDPADGSDTMVLTLSSAFSSENPDATITYTAGGGNLVNTSDTELASGASPNITDGIKPTVIITSSNGSDGDTVNDTTLSYTATFSESTSDFVIGDITVTGTANGGSPSASNFSGSGTTYTFDVVRGSSDGTVAVTVGAGVATDAAGNSNSVSNTYDFTIDQTRPTVTITSSTGSDGDTVNNTTLSYTATFSESVSDFVIGDITVSGTANGGSPAATNFAGSGTTYTFDVLRGSSDGTVIVNIAENVATDALSRTNQASNIYDLTIDTVAPTFTADRTGGDTIILTFSENVETTIIDGSGYTVTSGSVSANSNPSGSLTMTLTTSGITETDATPTITYNQTSGNTIDSVGNEVEHNQSTLATDSVSPTFVSAQTTIANRIDVTFSEAMAATGATPGDFVVGGTLSNTRIVVSITVSGDDLQLELDGDLSESDSPTISFTNSGIRPTDTATSPNDLENFGPESFLIDLSTAPTSPQNLFATVVNYESISLSWNAPLDDGGSSILGYKIERESPRGDGWAVLVSDTGNTETDYTDFGLSENTEYNYRISAINSIGTSTPSDSSFAKTLQIYRSSSDDKSFPPEFLGIGFYKFNFISDEQIKSDHYENPTESFGDYFPYSKYSDVLDKKRYENTGNYEKNGQYFLVDNYLKDIATFSADIDQPVQIQIRLLQERQTLEIHHLAIYLDIQDNSGKDALTYIIVDKDKPVKIVDPEGYIDDIVLNTSLEGTDFYYILDLTFKKAMNETDLFVEVWNENRDVSYLQMYDAFEIIDPALVEEKIEEIPSLVEVKITHDASSPICKSTNSCYTPKVANILEGGFVIWENQDSFLHTVTSGIPKTGADGKFNEIITPGNSFRYQFDTKGIYNYFCVIHPWASGIIKVYDQDGDLGTIQKTVEDLTIKSQRHGSSVIIENQDVLIAERVLKFDVSGSLQDDLGRNAVTITITDPNGKKSIVRGSTNDDGYFTVPIIIYEWQAGSYSVSVNSKDTQIGSISFFAIQRYDY